MAFVDFQNILAKAQDFTESGSTTSFLDCSQKRNLGSGDPMALVFIITTAADTSDPAEQYTFALQSDSDPAFGTAVTEAELTPDPATLIVGNRVIFPIPPSGDRYYRGYVTLAGSDADPGPQTIFPSVSASCYVTPLFDLQKDASFAAGFKIS